MTRSIIPDYLPDKCIGCEMLGNAITAREAALDVMGLQPTRNQIDKASRIGAIARELCERAQADCLGLAEGCMYEKPKGV